jgi:hypothetical protein
MNDAVIAATLAGKGPVDLSQPLKLYWVPGCTSCLRMKEFFTRHGVPFVSVNALEDQAAFDELAALGIKRVPIARRGRQWADGQLLTELAWIGGIELKQRKILAPAVLAERAERIQAAARSLLARIPAERLGENLPKRPRSYKQLGCHIFQIYESFLDQVEHGKPLGYGDYLRDVPDHVATRDDVLRFIGALHERFSAWWLRDGAGTDFARPAAVYYGQQTLHDFLERTVWHSAQHTRQLREVTAKLGLSTEGALTEADLADLPLPENIYDDTMQIS